MSCRPTSMAGRIMMPYTKGRESGCASDEERVPRSDKPQVTCCYAIGEDALSIGLTFQQFSTTRGANGGIPWINPLSKLGMR